MAVTFNNGRQSPLVGSVTLNALDVASGTATAVIKLPYNSVVTGGSIVVDTAWDSATSATIDVGDGTTADRYTATAPVDLKTLGYTALEPTGYLNASGEDIEVTITETGVPTVGTVRIYVEYIIADRATEVQTT